jgi:hypothetical protein
MEDGGAVTVMVVEMVMVVERRGWGVVEGERTVVD